MKLRPAAAQTASATDERRFFQQPSRRTIMDRLFLGPVLRRFFDDLPQHMRMMNIDRTALHPLFPL